MAEFNDRRPKFKGGPAQVPPIVRDYFGPDSTDREAHPIVTHEYSPDRGGWRSTNYKKRVSGSWVRKLKNQGVSRVMLKSGGRSAEFGVDEILSRKGR